jgi:hypothetical protein
MTHGASTWSTALPAVALQEEGSLAAVSEEHRVVRERLSRQLWRVPADVWDRLEYLQPQIGCFNACAFCSQAAGTRTWQFTLPALRDVLAALKAVRIAQSIAGGTLPEDALDSENGLLRVGVRLPPGGLLGAARVEHKPGVIFPYLDNDVFSYPGLHVLAQSLAHDFGVRVRFTTVGMSRRNAALVDIHRRLVRELTPAIDGVRFSFTPYAIGWRAPVGFAREEYVADFAHMLKVYRPAVDALGTGRDRACIEIRTPPLVEVFPGEPLTDTFVSDYHVVQSGPYLAIGLERGAAARPTHITRVDGRTPRYSASAVEYVLVVADGCRSLSEEVAVMCLDRALANGGDYLAHFRAALAPMLGDADMRFAEGYRFTNADGEYYAFDPYFRNGQFRAVQLYPQTDRRPVSGYLDTTRFILNAIHRNRGRTSESDLGVAVGRTLKSHAASLDSRHRHAAAHVRHEILPLWRGLVTALKTADYPLTYLADPGFCIDTGVIVNQGRATRLFGGLASRPDMPLTPHEERGYGDVSFDSRRRPVFRFAPRALMTDRSRPSRGATGPRNSPAEDGQALVEELDGWLRPTGTVRYVIRGLEVEEMPATFRRRRHMVPGVKSS